MRIKIDPDLYQWLLKMGLLKQIISREKAPSGKFLLTEKESFLFETGLLFKDLLFKICEMLQMETNFSIILREENNGHSRAYNWNILLPEFQALGVTLDSQIKGRLFTADPHAYNETLREIYEITVLKIDHLSAMSTTSHKSNNSIQSTIPKSKSKGVNIRPEAVNLELLSSDKPLEESSNLLEFLIISLCKHLKLAPKQSAVLLGSNNKYMGHLLVKGLKGNFEPIKGLLQEIYINTATLLSLLSSDDLAIEIVLQTFKPSLVSKNEEIGRWGCRLYSKILYELANDDGHSRAFEWFISENGGLHTCILAHRRHPDLSDSITSILIQAGRWNLNEMLVMHLKKFLPDECEFFSFIRAILPSLISSNSTSEELLTGGTLGSWVEYALRIAGAENRDNIDSRMSSLAFLCEVWVLVPVLFESQDSNSLSLKLLGLLKKCTRENSFLLSIFSISQLFGLLHGLASSRNIWAPFIFKTLTFSLIENHADVTLRQMMLECFIDVIEKFSSIPVGVVLEPFLKQLSEFEGKTFAINIFDLEFIGAAIRHPQLQIKDGLLTLDILAKFFLNRSIFSSIIEPHLITIFTRFSQESPFQEYILKFSKVCLSNCVMSLTAKSKTKIKTILESDSQILEAQKRASIINFIKKILQMQIYPINEQILQAILTASQESPIDYKGFEHLISFFGNPFELIREFAAEERRKEKERQIELNQLARDQGFISSDLGRNSIRNSEKKDEKFATFVDNQFPTSNEFFNTEILVNQGFDEPSHNDDEISSELKFKAELESKGIGLRNKGKKGKPPSYRAFTELEAIKARRQGNIEKESDFQEFKLKREETSRAKARDEARGRFDERISFFDLGAEEEFHSISFGLTIRKESRFLRKVFDRFSEGSKVSLKMLRKLISEIGLEKGFNKEMTALAVRGVNERRVRDAVDGLEFEGFVEFLLQVGVNYEREIRKHEIVNETAGKALEWVINRAKEKFVSIGLVDPLDEEVSTLNFRLLHDPDRTLPKGFRKVAEKEQLLTPKLPSQLNHQIPVSYILSYTIVSELIQQLFHSSPLEVFSSHFFVTRAKRTDRLPTIENLKRGKSAKSNLNTLELEKLSKAQEELRVRAEQERRMAKRKAELDVKMKEIREKSAQNRILNDHSKSQQESSKSQNKEFDSKSKAEAQRKKEALAAYKAKLESEKLLAAELLSRQTEASEVLRKREREKFLSAQNQKLKKQFEETKIAREKEDEETRIQRENAEAAALKSKEIQEKRLKADKERREQEVKNKERIENLRTEPKISKIFSDYSKSIGFIYEFYGSLTKTIDNSYGKMGLKEYLTMCHQFGLAGLLGNDELTIAFRQSIKEGIS